MKNEIGTAATTFLKAAGLLSLTALLLAAAAGKPSHPSPRIGVVDSKRVAAESKAIRAMITDAAEKAQKLRDELQKNKLELSARVDAYSQQRSVVADDERQRREEAIDQLRDDIDVLDFRLGREIRKSQESTVGPMGLRILSAVREVSKEEGLTLVFTTQEVVHFDASHDITALVIEKLDKQ